MAERLPPVIGDSFKRFAAVYGVAGHLVYVFAATADELERQIGGIVSYGLIDGERYHHRMD